MGINTTATKQEKVYPSVSIVDITPQMAEEFLERNTHNRHIINNSVQRYAQDMLDGNWELTGHSIAIDWNGIVLDGQNRLAACVVANAPFKTLLVTGLDPKVFTKTDVGVPRKPAHALQVLHEKYSFALAAALGWVYKIEAVVCGSATDKSILRSKGKFTQDQVTAVLDEHPYIRGYVAEVASTRSLYSLASPAIIASCYYMFATQNKELADQFMRKLKTGIGMLESDPVYVLRERLLREKGQLADLPSHHLVALFFKAWIWTKSGKRLSSKSLKWDQSREEFPTIGKLGDVTEEIYPNLD